MYSGPLDIIASLLVLLVILAAGLLLVAPGLWFINLTTGTIGWGVSGEAGSLLPRGLGTRTWRLRRGREMQRVIGHAAIAARLNLPMVSSLRAAALGEPDHVADILNQMARLLSVGCPLHEALRMGIPRCPSLLVGMVRKGEECGQTARALTRLEEALGRRLKNMEWNRSQYVPAYAVIMLAMITLLTAFYMVKLAPMIKEIFLDYDVELPRTTQVFLHVVDWFHGGAGLPLLLAAVAFIIVAPVYLAIIRRQDGRSPAARLISAVRWALPLTRNVDYGYGMASTIRNLETAVVAGVPLDRAVDGVAAVDPLNHLRGRLERFADDVKRGALPHIAAAQAGLGTVFVAALKMVERGESPQRSLEHAAEYYHAIGDRSWRLVSNLSTPLVTLVAASGVVFILLALYLPWITLIESISGWSL